MTQEVPIYKHLFLINNYLFIVGQLNCLSNHTRSTKLEAYFSDSKYKRKFN
jgi:hypothetical protein